MTLFQRLNTIYVNTGLTLAFGLISFTFLSSNHSAAENPGNGA
jgi:hypothetical protein